MQIISCQSSIELATKIAAIKNYELIIAMTQSFTGGEMKIHLPKALDKEIYIVQSFNKSVNNQLMELILTIDAARASGAHNINIVAPYFPYSRQDSKESLTSHGLKIIANLLNNCNINRLITMDFHAPKALSLFAFTVTNISIDEIIMPFAQDRLIICPDKGATKRNKFNQIIRLGKKREGDDLFFELSDDIKGKDCLIIDDIIDSGRTICLAAKTLAQNGAKSIQAYATHALFLKDTQEMLNASLIEKLYISNSVENTLLPNNTITLDITKIITDNF